MIQCDEVFAILTRGPFPTGAASDSLVEAHLERCAECRRLAEALRPAMVAAPEAVAPEEGANLPCYGGVVAGRRLETPSTCRGPRRTNWASGERTWSSLERLGTPLLQFAAAAAVGSMLAVGLVRWDGNRFPMVGNAPGNAVGELAPSGVVPAHAIKSATERAGNVIVPSEHATTGSLSWKASMSLACLLRRDPAAPATLVPAAGVASERAAEYQCCTRCHAACSPVPVGRGTAQVAAACRSCH